MFMWYYDLSNELKVLPVELKGRIEPEVFSLNFAKPFESLIIVKIERNLNEIVGFYFKSILNK